MIVNTRPVDLGQKTNLLLQKFKCNFVHLPLTKILKIKPAAQAIQNITNLSNYDLLIFTSQSAVTYGAKYCQKSFQQDARIPILAIGRATQESLKKFNLPSKTPSTFDSEGLAEVIKQKGYKKCMIFCGEKKPRMLSLSDIEIDTFPCYSSQEEDKIDLLKIQGQDKLVFLIYTQQTLEVLMRQLSVNTIQKIILIVASKRIKELAIQHGFKKCILANSPHDEEMVEAALAVY